MCGAFQPPHPEQVGRVRRALNLTDKVILVISPALCPRALRTPLTFGERVSMLEVMFTTDEWARVVVYGISNFLYQPDAWRRSLEVMISDDGVTLGDCALLRCEEEPVDRIERVLAPVQIVEMPSATFSAERVRDELYSGASKEPSMGTLGELNLLDHFEQLRSEFDAVCNFRESWRGAPWPPIFVTTDAVVVHNGSILMIRRGHSPGRGLWALPGGFVDQHESIFDACIRELIEETAIDISPDTLRTARVDSDIFDAPYRSVRGRTITHAFSFALAGNDVEITVSAGDDAADAVWVRIDEINPAQVFEDHYPIIQRMLATMPATTAPVAPLLTGTSGDVRAGR